ncbi:MAG: flagellar assembly protein FliW [Lachnospiraceae bacterium]|nr:flagellar assembly protein FliW [Lachnospiraceae bacterium]
MIVNTKIFGEVTIDDHRIIHFINGIIGFPELKDFTLIHDQEQGDQAGIRWMQSIQEPAFAMPVIDPLSVMLNFNPQVNDELLTPLGKIEPDEMLVLVTITVPGDISQMSVNLRAPIVINSGNRKACQIIVEGEQYAVKYPVYEILQRAKEAAAKEGK